MSERKIGENKSKIGSSLAINWNFKLSLHLTKLQHSYSDINQCCNWAGSSGSHFTRVDCFIKYLGLTRILHRTWVNKDVSQWQCCGWRKHIMLRHFEKNHCWWCGNTKKSNKIALWVQVACTATALSVFRPYDMPDAYQCSMVTGAYNWNIDKHPLHYMSWVCETTLSTRLIVASSHHQWIYTLICSSSSYMTVALKNWFYNQSILVVW